MLALLATLQIRIGEITVNINSINPNLLYGGFLLMLILSGLGEYLHILPTGTLQGLLFGIFGGGLAHVSFAVGNNQAQAAQAQTAKIATEVVATTQATTNGLDGGANGSGKSQLP